MARDEDFQIPKPVLSNLFNGKVVRIACGAHHVLAKTETSVYGWGWNNHSQTGIPNGQQVISKPTIIEKLSTRRVRDISAGNAHSVASTASGRIVTWGSNDFGGIYLLFFFFFAVFYFHFINSIYCYSFFIPFFFFF